MPYLKLVGCWAGLLAAFLSTGPHAAAIAAVHGEDFASSERLAGAAPFAPTLSLDSLVAAVVAAFSSAPALGVALAVLALALPLATFGLAGRWLSRRVARAGVPESSDSEAADRQAPSLEAAASEERTGFARPRDAWIEAVGDQGGIRHPIRRGLTRIGNAEDNDIRLQGRGAERYHAAIERTRELDHYLVDLTKPGSGRVRVNGKAVSRQRLRAGDSISLGENEFRFVATPSEMHVGGTECLAGGTGN
ncbi:MAG: FHA domain-containing protein [Hyphomicrobiaceae bacterium]